jgi:STAS-like domain of unknown function (DUF4325)
VIGRYHGNVLRQLATESVAKDGGVVMDFSGIEMITQSAADEFIGRIVRYNSALLERIRFQHCAEAVKEMIQWAEDNADSVAQRQHAFC